MILLLLILYILFYPAEAVNAAARGLLLWYKRVLPALLPFAILSNILITSGYAAELTGHFSVVLRRLFPVSESGFFVLVTGFLFGFPMGSKNCAELLKEGTLTISEARVLFCIANNISPAFIGGYILTQELGLPKLFGQSLLLLYGPPLFFGYFFLKKNASGQTAKKAAPRSQMNFKIIDASIMNGFEALVKIGGYIMFFSIVISMTDFLPLPDLLKLLLVGTLELTNGIHLIARGSLPAGIKYLLAMFFTAFGGISGIAQTGSMIKGTHLSLKTYVQTRLLLAMCTAILVFLLQWLPTWLPS